MRLNNETVRLAWAEAEAQCQHYSRARRGLVTCDTVCQEHYFSKVARNARRALSCASKRYHRALMGVQVVHT